MYRLVQYTDFHSLVSCLIHSTNTSNKVGALAYAALIAARHLLHEGVGERADASRRMVATYCRRSVFSPHLSRIPLVRGMSRLDDGSAGYAEVEDEQLLEVGL